MNINATLFGEMITFAIFIWITMKYIWPPIMKAMEERRKKVAEGLAAAERGEKSLLLAQEKSKTLLMDSKIEASHILDQATSRSNKIIEDGKNHGREEGQRMMTNAKKEIDHQVQIAKELLKTDVIDIVIKSTQKILKQEVDEKAHEKMLQDLIKDIAKT